MMLNFSKGELFKFNQSKECVDWSANEKECVDWSANDTSDFKLNYEIFFYVDFENEIEAKTNQISTDRDQIFLFKIYF
jgi:hypothetical protein